MRPRIANRAMHGPPVRSQTMETTTPASVVPSNLPPEWVPEGAGVWVIARRRPAAKQWEALVPEFNIAGMGDTSQAAIANAFGLLDGYLVLCAAEGKSFEDTYRPIGRRWKFDLLREAILAGLTTKKRRPRKPDHSYLRLPIATAH
jgi:hypothetical protein